MKPVYELYYNNSYILCHCKKHLSQVFHLLFLTRIILYLSELCNSVDQLRNAYRRRIEENMRERSTGLRLVLTTD